MCGLLTSRIPGTRLRAPPRLRDALTRAKDANPTTLLTRFAEELRRAPEAGGGEKSDYSFDLEVFSEVSFRSCL